MFLRRYSHSLPTERPTVYERRVYGLNVTKGTLRKSTVLAFLYCFEKASNLFNSGKRHSLQLSRLISPQNVFSQGTVSF